MPKPNPKHAQKKVVTQRQIEMAPKGLPTRYWIMGLIFIGVLAVIAVVVANIDDIINSINTSKDKFIEPGDWAKMNVKIWKEVDGRFPIENTPDFQQPDWKMQIAVNNSALAPGWYQYMINNRMKENGTAYITLPANIDANQDNIDDITSQPIQGFTQGTFANTKCLVWIEIKKIVKEKDYPTEGLTFIWIRTLNTLLGGISRPK